MTRGILLKADVKDDWVPVKLSCLGFAPGELESIDQAAWQRLDSQSTAVLLKATMEIDGQGRLAFTEATPQGTTAVVMLPKLEQSIEAA